MRKCCWICLVTGGLLLAAMAWLLTPARAGVSCSVPFNLTNGTTADASQVMANYNAILSCLSTSTAASGNNMDITALLGLTTPIAPSQGGSPVFAGGSTTGSANAYVLASTTPSGFVLTRSYTVIAIANFTNTGAATINVNSTGATNIFKLNSGAAVALVSGDIVSGQVMALSYDGTQFELLNPATTASLSSTNQNVSGGATVTSNNLGTLSTGTTTLNCGLSPLQYFTNGGTFTLAAPVNDGSCAFLMTNNNSANFPNFSGFTVGNNIGDAIDTNNGDMFILSVTRINGISTYFWKALQ